MGQSDVPGPGFYWMRAVKKS